MNKIEPWQVIVFMGLTALLYGFAQDFIDWTGWIEPPVIGDKFGALARGCRRFISSVILSAVIAGAIYAFFSWLASIPADDPRCPK